MKPSTWSLKHPIPVLVITAGAVLFGIIALLFLNREFVPPMVMPTSSVVTLWPGVSAEDVESDITTVLEDYFASLPGMTDLNSESREGISIIKLKFTEDTNVSEILQEVRIRVDRASTDLPDNLRGKPLVSIWGASDLPVFSFAVSGPWDSDRISRYVEDTVIPEIYKVNGVADAKVLGDRRLVLQVKLDVDAMAAVNVAPLDVMGAIRNRNTTLPAGLVNWSGGEWAFRVAGEFTEITDIENLIVGNKGSSPVRLADISTVSEVYEEASERVRSGAQDLVVIQVTKRETGNALIMSRGIRERLGRLETEGSEGYRYFVLHDDSGTIRSSLGTVVKSALTGIAMAIAVIFLFFRSWRYTMVVALSLPVSLVITFAGMKLFGQSINVLTLAGITVSLGMVVDASIVVLENIHRRHASGENADTAALAGAGSVSSAVIASTTTSLSVFVPMMFLSGIIGSVLTDLSLTIVLSLGASLFAALFLVPPLARRGLLRNEHRKRKSGFMSKIEKSYGSSLKQSLNMSGTVIFTAAAVLIISVLAADMMGLSFIPAADYDEIFISLDLPSGSSLEESTAAADRAEVLIRSELPELSEIIFYAGMEDDLSGDARKREAVWGQLLLKPEIHRKRDFREIIEVLNESLPPVLPGIAVTIFNGGFDRLVSMGADGFGYRVELSSASMSDLNTAAERVESILGNDPDILSTVRDISEDRRFITAQLDGESMGQLGVSAYDAALTARIAFEGMDAGDYRPLNSPDRSILLNTTLDGESPDAAALGRLSVRTSSGKLTAIDTFSSVHDDIGVSGIRRHDRARTLTVIGFTKSENIRDITRRLKSSLEQQPLNSGVEWRLTGVGGLIGDSLTELGLVILIALFLVYAVMAIQFERLVQPLIIMASVPFSFIGVVGGLAVFGSDISLISFLGIVALAGIVVNNAIVQVDRINQLRNDGMGLDDAVIKGSVSRLRPIMMTTLTTFFGVLPLSFAQGSGARIYAPLGQAIAGGLVTSTLVTLFLIPTLYRLVEKRKEIKAAGAGLEHHAEAGVA